ncbi:MAG: hypothetical protein A3G25_12980 [Betaproteobacteria bacterium RIFCSPLOWO2_12_FULL_63_13]|nr:MAG: hypothetical protein A3G25_12980 [Betaproteobacteria bacterium RIFCSPLOWO2_12_FULL_63_13]
MRRTGRERKAIVRGNLQLLNLGIIMEWLSQNWIWLAFAALVIYMMRGGAAGGCCGGGHGARDKRTESESSDGKSSGAADCCGGGHGADDKPSETAGTQTKPAPAAAGHER